MPIHCKQFTSFQKNANRETSFTKNFSNIKYFDMVESIVFTILS